jgi:hypothetical protein
MSRLDYYNGKEHHTGFRISASGISRFFSATSSWYRENLLGESGFTGSTASVLGTVVHGILEGYLTKNPLSESEIDSYLNEQAKIIPDLDIQYIMNQYPTMSAVAIDYLESLNLTDVVSEEFVHLELLPEIHVGGSIDLYSPTIVWDFKTYSSTQPPKSISYPYRMQLLTYAAIKIAQGVPIKYISTINISTEIVGEISPKTGKQFKSYPSDVIVLTEAITAEDLDMIRSTHTLIAESVRAFRDQPHFRHLLSQDLRLKGCSCTLKKQEEEI